MEVIRQRAVHGCGNLSIYKWGKLNSSPFDKKKYSEAVLSGRLYDLQKNAASSAKSIGGAKTIEKSV